MQQLARKRAVSDATTVGPVDETLVDDPGQIEVFNKDIHWRNVSFNRVRLYHSRQGRSASKVVESPQLMDTFSRGAGHRVPSRAHLGEVIRDHPARTPLCVIHGGTLQAVSGFVHLDRRCFRSLTLVQG